MWANLVSNWEQNMLCTKSGQTLCWKRMSMLTGLKASSLTCKCVFYRPKNNAIGVPNELNFEALEMQKWNIWTDRVRRVDDKNGSFF